MYRKKQKVTHHYQLRSASKRKCHTVSSAFNNNAERKDFHEIITALEQKLADKGTLLNLNMPVKEEELRKLAPELVNIETQLKLEKKQIVKENIKLEKLLEEKRRLEERLKENYGRLNEYMDFEKRLLGAKEKLEDFSNEVMKLEKGGENVAKKNINSVPTEVMMKIFGYLRHNELAITAQVCRKWNVLSKSPDFWKIVDVELSDCETATVKNFLQTLPSYVICLKINTREYEFSVLNFEEICVTLQEKCSNLQMLALCVVQFSDDLQSIIDVCTKYLPSVKRLVINHCEFANDGYYSLTKSFSDVPKIEALDIVNFITDLKYPPFSKMPSLKALNLQGMDVDDWDDEDWFFRNNEYAPGWLGVEPSFLNQLEMLNLGFTSGIFSSRAFRNILQYGLNLKELYLCRVGVKDKHLSFNNAVFPNLKTICLRKCRRVTCEGIVSLIQSCQSLDNVYVNDSVAESYAKHPFVNLNSSMLEIVKPVHLCGKHVKYHLSC